MFFYIIILLSGISMGLTISFSLIYISKLKEYIDLKAENGNAWLKLLVTSLKVFLPIVFGAIALVLPVKLLCFFVTDANLIKDLSSYYLYSFVGTFSLCTFLLIKTKRLKTKSTLK